MNKTGAWLATYALEQIGVEYTFGIPGVHNTELYDELNNSKKILPMLVTHECGGSFMADAISRTTTGIGCMVVVPAAGLTHAASGIAEASLDGIPMLIITGGIRTDSEFQYQLHDMDQHALMAPITKATFQITSHEDIIPTIYRAYDIAMSDEPGPVFIDLPANLQFLKEKISSTPTYQSFIKDQKIDKAAIREAAELLCNAKQAGIFAGWGAAESSEYLVEISNWLGAPVATTLQGLSVFPASHPLHVGMGFGPSAVPAGENAFKDIDAMLAIGTRFSEIPTGSFGCKVPKDLVHLDINPDVFNKNYPAKFCLSGDASEILPLLLDDIKSILKEKKNATQLADSIRRDKDLYREEWFSHDSKDMVNPALFFDKLSNKLNQDDYIVCDDGNHTFLTAELMPIYKSGHFISPTDFNAMGYGVPATIATKLSHENKNVVGIVGDGAFLMTCMELITAKKYKIAPIIVVFNDGELSQISQAQDIPYNRKTCTLLSDVDVSGVALAVGARYVPMVSNDYIETAINEAIKHSKNGRAVIVDVNVDYSKATRFTKGIVKTNTKRLKLKVKTRFIGRAILRKITG